MDSTSKVPGTSSSHLLGLKVMRMRKPSLFKSAPVVLGEPQDALGRSLDTKFLEDITTSKNIPFFSTGEVLALPQSFGLIFLGETFTGFVTVNNESQEIVTDAELKIELLTSSHRVPILTSPISQLDPGASEDHIITHEVKELGEHNLICTVTYSSSSSVEEFFMRKFYKFGVAKPLDVKTKFSTMEDDVLLEVQIQNTTPNPMFLEVMRFDPASSFTVEEFNTFESRNEENHKVSVSVFGKENYLNPRSTRQYLYRITPLVSVQTAGRATNMSVGKMDIVWRTNFGDRGRIQTGQLKAVIPPAPELKVTVVQRPGTVHIEQPFNITCAVTNMGIHNELAPSETMELTFTALPLQPGLQNLCALSFVDMLRSQKRHHFNKLGQVLVDQQPPPQEIHFT